MSSISQHHKGCVTMATSKQSFVRATEPQCSASAQREEETCVKAPLTTMYVHSVPGPGPQPYSQTQPGALQDATVVPLFLPRMCNNSTLPSLTLQIASGAVFQQQRVVAPAISGRPKSAGKHICPQCGKDCLKPSVLENIFVVTQESDHIPALPVAFPSRRRVTFINTSAPRLMPAFPANLTKAPSAARRAWRV